MSIDEQRELLNRRKEAYKNALTASVEQTKTAIGNKLQTFAFAAGAILLGYLVVKVVEELTDKKEKTQPSLPDYTQVQQPQQLPVYQQAPPVQESGFSFTNFLKEQLAFFLVSLAKDKIYELIDIALHNLRQQLPEQPDEQKIPDNNE